MSRVYQSHPSDWLSIAGAPYTSSRALTEAYESTLTDIRERHGVEGVAGALEALSALAIARVELLERELTRRRRQLHHLPVSRQGTRARLDPVIRDERAAHAALHQPSGNVIPLPVGRRA